MCCDCGGDFGGIGGTDGTVAYNTPFNTTGVGDVVPASTHSCGSGDVMYPFMGYATQRQAPKIKQKKRTKAKTYNEPNNIDLSNPLPLYVPVK